jgi:hypothetical protein
MARDEPGFKVFGKNLFWEIAMTNTNESPSSTNMETIKKLDDQARGLFARGDFNAGITALTQEAELCKTTKNYDGYVRSLLNLSIAHIKNNQLFKAMATATTASEFVDDKKMVQYGKTIVDLLENLLTSLKKSPPPVFSRLMKKTAKVKNG